MDPQLLRTALGRFTTGVSIVTCLDADRQPIGLTANSFQALSLQPPLVLWSLRATSVSLPAYLQSPTFAVNVLAESHVDLSRRFATRLDDRFAEGAWSAGTTGAPVLAGCVAVFECERVSHQAAGDHVLIIGRVLTSAEAPIAPLVFQAGHYHMLGEIL
jgi:flavin reductase (DIM6/NTAB) family NADH-FMN oxidoreductase RutF